jgi:16S rRNA (adenine1518-N6/adenine1519-N6)-dimethyltransferase
MHTPFQKIDAKKSLGQHFLNNQHVPALMADSGNVQKGDVVVEVGPGTGVLTRALLERGATVIALEADTRAIEALEQTFAKEIMAQKLVISHTDVRSLDLASLGLKAEGYKVVANIPYYLSGFLFRSFLENDCFPSDLVFLVQKEVAERIARDPKESLLSLSVKVFGTPKYIKTVGKGNFTPPPKIDSAIITVSHISHDRVKHIGVRFFFEILHEGFKSKRKQLLGNLSGKYSRGSLEEIFNELQLPLDIRGEDLTLPKWLLLCERLREVE